MMLIEYPGSYLAMFIDTNKRLASKMVVIYGHDMHTS